MSRLIDADEFCLDIKTGRIKETYYLSNMHKQMIIDQIDKRKTIDAVPVVHGHWNVHEDTYGDDEAKCSVCGFEMAVNQPGNGLCMVSELNYCPHCGAKMDEVTE